jgi:hypothetical protein
VIPVFDLVAAGYDDAALRFFPFCADRLISRLNPAPGTKLLDIATGTGVVALAFVLAGVRTGKHAWAVSAAIGGLLVLLVVVMLLGRRPERPTPSVPGWRATLRQLWVERRPAVVAIALLCLAQHAVLITEAWVMLRALGAEPTLATVIVFEGVTKTVNSVGVVVPGRLGVSEGGSAAMASALGLGASFGLSLALMRRVRALLWAVIGVSLVVPELWRLWRSPSNALAVTPT